MVAAPVSNITIASTSSNAGSNSLMDQKTPVARTTDKEAATVVFIDLAGFSAITDVYGDATAIAMLEVFESIVCSALEDHAPPIKWIGDEVMLSFPDPQIAILTVGKLLSACRNEPRLPLTRTALHHGPVIRRASDLFGSTVNISARIAALAAPGQAAAGVVGHPGPLKDACTNLTALVTGAQAIMAGYEVRKRALGVIDYADMIAGCEALLRNHPNVLASVLGEVDCVIIDEFQDTNPVQFAFLWQLAARAPRCLLVGDAKQSIMGFQGADPRLSQALAEANPGAVDPLRQNWRSNPRLTEALNAVGQGLFGTT